MEKNRMILLYGMQFPLVVVREFYQGYNNDINIKKNEIFIDSNSDVVGLVYDVYFSSFRLDEIGLNAWVKDLEEKQFPEIYSKLLEKWVSIIKDKSEELITIEDSDSKKYLDLKAEIEDLDLPENLQFGWYIITH